jgi:integrase/recombinase XerD
MSRPQIDPQRRSLPLPAWPDNDRALWNAAITPDGLFGEQGKASHWRQSTRATNLYHYSRFLGYLLWIDELDEAASPGDRVTPERVRRYSGHLAGLVAPRTRLSMLVGLKVMMKAMVPERDWAWLQRCCNRLQVTAKPSRDKRARMRPTGEIVDAAIGELGRLVHEPPTIKTAIAYRDALMLALLAARPLRVKNFTTLELGRHLRVIEGGWLIDIPAAETKTSDPISFELPHWILPWFAHYLEKVRPLFPEAGTSSRLWLGKDGVPHAPSLTYLRITKLTARLFGTPINPHLLRDCAASSLAAEAPESAHFAKALLGHRHLATTERNYIQADNLAASRRVNGLLAGVLDLEKISSSKPASRRRRPARLPTPVLEVTGPHFLLEHCRVRCHSASIWDPPRDT